MQIKYNTYDANDYFVHHIKLNNVAIAITFKSLSRWKLFFKVTNTNRFKKIVTPVIDIVILIKLCN